MGHRQTRHTLFYCVHKFVFDLQMKIIMRGSRGIWRGGGVGKGATWRFAPINDSHQDQLSLKTFCARTFRAEFNLIIWGIKNYSLSIHVCGYQIQSGVINSNKSRSFISERHWEMLKFYNNDMLRFFNIQC